MRRVLWALILIAASAAPASAQQAVNLAFATLDTGSAWYVYGATMAEILRKTLPPGSNIDVKPRAGGVGNPRLVAKNETPLGFGFTVTNRWAYEGKEAYDARLDNLRALVGGLDTYYMVAVAAKKLGIGSVRDIKERRLAVRATSQPVGSLGEFSARQLLRSADMSYADLKSWGGSREQRRAGARARRARRVRPGDRVAAGEGGDPPPPRRRTRVSRERVDAVGEGRPCRAGGGLDGLPALHGPGRAL